MGKTSNNKNRKKKFVFCSKREKKKNNNSLIKKVTLQVNLLRPILEKKDFEYDFLFRSLPREMWKLIFAFLEKKEINVLILVSKSFFYFLHLNPPECWKTLAFDGKFRRKDEFRAEIIKTLSLARY